MFSKDVRAFKISPDGSRIALIRRSTKGPPELGLARIVRSGDKAITVDGWQALDPTQKNMPPVTRMTDVAWLDATNLLVLGRIR